MLLEDFNLCDIMIEEMEKLQFKQSSIDYIKSSQHFQTAQRLPSTLQRSQLTMLISYIFAMGPEIVPYQIRLSLAMADDTMNWIRDLKIVLIPFLRENEDKFFTA